VAASLLTSGTFTFADGSGGHSCNLGSSPAVGDLDVLCVNSNTVVSTPAGFSIGETRVNNQGSYVFCRIAAGGDASTVTVTTSGNHNTEVIWSRWAGIATVDSGGHGDAGTDSSSGTATPQLTTGALAETGELVVAFAALHSIGSANQSSPVWTAAYTPLTTAAQGTGATGVRGYVAYRLDGGTAAQTLDLSWSGDGCFNRYMLAVGFTSAETEPIVGVVAGTLPALAGSITGTVQNEGDLAGTLLALAGALAGEVRDEAVLAGTLPALAGALTAVRSASRTATITGALLALAGSAAGTAAQPRGSWYGLLAILRDATREALDARSRPPAACPNDGEPLQPAPGGGLHCAWDGYRWP
jgi:hypothetical protein